MQRGFFCDSFLAYTFLCISLARRSSSGKRKREIRALCSAHTSCVVGKQTIHNLRSERREKAAGWALYVAKSTQIFVEEGEKGKKLLAYEWGNNLGEIVSSEEKQTKSRKNENGKFAERMQILLFMLRCVYVLLKRESSSAFKNGAQIYFTVCWDGEHGININKRICSTRGHGHLCSDARICESFVTFSCNSRAHSSCD